MYVHRSVGHVTYVTIDLVLGAEGTTALLEETLRRLEPATITLDLTVDDLGTVPNGEFKDTFLHSHALGVKLIEEEPAIQPYKRLLAWAKANQTDIRPIAPRMSLGVVQGRRMARLIERSDGDLPDARARSGYEALLKDSRVGPLTERRRDDMIESLQNVVEAEPPRLLVAMAYPWGETVSGQVRRRLGLQRVEGDALRGGWPD